MFSQLSLRGEPITADYARQRVRLEPIVEITQYKAILKLIQIFHLTMSSPTLGYSPGTYRESALKTTKLVLVTTCAQR